MIRFVKWHIDVWDHHDDDYGDEDNYDGKVSECSFQRNELVSAK